MRQTDNSLFVKYNNKSIIILLIYADDILITRNDYSSIHCMLTSLYIYFDMRHLGGLKHFLGIDVIRHSSSILLSQEQYATQLLHKSGMASCSSYPIPMSIQKISSSMYDPLKIQGSTGV